MTTATTLRHTDLLSHAFLYPAHLGHLADARTFAQRTRAEERIEGRRRVLNRIQVALIAQPGRYTDVVECSRLVGQAVEAEIVDARFELMVASSSNVGFDCSETRDRVLTSAAVQLRVALEMDEILNGMSDAERGALVARTVRQATMVRTPEAFEMDFMDLIANAEYLVTLTNDDWLYELEAELSQSAYA